jgi:hypothetical protein
LIAGREPDPRLRSKSRCWTRGRDRTGVPGGLDDVREDDSRAAALGAGLKTPVYCYSARFVVAGFQTRAYHHEGESGGKQATGGMDNADSRHVNLLPAQYMADCDAAGIVARRRLDRSARVRGIE